MTPERAADIRSRHDAVRDWLKANKRNSYKTEELVAAGLKPTTNAELGELELFEFKRDKPAEYFAYVSLPDGWDRTTGTRLWSARVERWRQLYGRTGKLTAWPGNVLGTVQFGRAFEDNFGGVRVPISATAVTGELYHGTYYASAGDYCRIKKAKHQPVNLSLRPTC